MIKKCFLSFFTMLLTATARAQHFPFDNSGIIVVNVHRDKDSALLTRLKINLIDSNGKWVADFW